MISVKSHRSSSNMGRETPSGRERPASRQTLVPANGDWRGSAAPGSAAASIIG
jgi:hypothetical protein